MTVTPSPQSVVSDRALEQIAFNLCSLHDFPVDFVKANERFARSVITEYLRAAPAPSSLAGGEVERPLGAAENGTAFLDRIEHNYDFSCEGGELKNCAEWHEARRCFEVLADFARHAALSPEAPARDGVEKACADFQEAIDYFEADVADALAEDSERADLWDREVTVNIDALKTVMNAALPPRHEAQAEGAGEREEAFCEAYYQAHLDHAWAALRDGKPYQVNSDGAISLIQQAAADRRAVKAWQMTARSSAPEAREGEADWWWVKGAARLCGEEVFSRNRVMVAAWEDSDQVEILPLYTHPAAPSADKLREAMPDLSSVIAWLENGCEPKHAVTELSIYKARIDQALSTPDALKGDARP